MAEPGRLFDCTTVDPRGNLRGATRLKAPLREVLDRIERGEMLYVTEWLVFRQAPWLNADIDVERPGLPHPLLSVEPKVYIGPARTFTPMHFDYAPNITAHVVGRKRWVAYSPDQTRFIYRYPWPGRFSHFSQVNSLERLADRARYPLLERTRPVECVVAEGELLYMPERWWHHVESIDQAISVHFFWKPWPLFARQLLVDPFDRLLRRTHASRVDPRTVTRRALSRLVDRARRA